MNVLPAVQPRVLKAFLASLPINCSGYTYKTSTKLSVRQCSRIDSEGLLTKVFKKITQPLLNKKSIIYL